MNLKLNEAGFSSLHTHTTHNTHTHTTHTHTQHTHTTHTHTHTHNASLFMRA